VVLGNSLPGIPSVARLNDHPVSGSFPNKANHEDLGAGSQTNLSMEA